MPGIWYALERLNERYCLVCNACLSPLNDKGMTGFPETRRAAGKWTDLRVSL